MFRCGAQERVAWGPGLHASMKSGRCCDWLAEFKPVWMLVWRGVQILRGNFPLRLGATTVPLAVSSVTKAERPQCWCCFHMGRCRHGAT